jgi:DNA-binding IclR family transcriptional regulator
MQVMSLVECPPDQRVSVILFGNRHRLELLAALANTAEDGVSLTQLALARGVSASVYYAPLRDLMSLGLVIRREAPDPRDRRRWYHRSEHRLWDSVRALVDALTEVEVLQS